MILRRFLKTIFRVFYRLEIEGLEHLEAVGGHVVIAPNHVSFLDPALIRALVPHDPVYAIDWLRTRQRWVQPFLRFGRTVPVDPLHPLGVRSLIAAAKAGHPVVVFPEGRLTTTGRMMKFYSGAAFIAERAEVPVLPVFIDGLERSPFSLLGKRQVRGKWFPRVTVRIFPPVRLDDARGLSPKMRRAALTTQTETLMFSLPFHVPDPALAVTDAVNRAARDHGRRRTVFEDRGKAVSYRAIIDRSGDLGARLASVIPTGAGVGVLLPSQLDMIVVTLGAMSIGRVPAFIDRERSPESIAAWCRAADIKGIVTSRTILRDARFLPLISVLARIAPIMALEDLEQQRTRPVLYQKAPSGLGGANSPALILQSRDDECRAIVLSHRNLLAGAAQILAHLELGHADRIFCTMNLSHAAGFMSGVLIPLLSGACSILYRGPTHPGHVGDAIYNANPSILFSSWSDLRGYATGAHAYDLRSLRLVFACDGPLDPEFQHGFQTKFGLRILPCVSCDEASGFLAFSVPTFYRPLAAGRLVPGLEAKFVASSGTTDRTLMLRGPSAMIGYFTAARPGQIVRSADGWQPTTMTVTIDAENYVVPCALRSSLHLSDATTAPVHDANAAARGVEAA